MEPTLIAASPANLVAGIDQSQYTFVEHAIPARHALPRRQRPGTCRTFVVIAGEVRLDCLDEHDLTMTRRYGRWTGWHALPASTYQMINDGDQDAVVLEAGTVTAEVQDGAGLVLGSGPSQPCVDVSGYMVDKPWGHEIWYTENLSAPAYAVKQIHMTAGHQSSLQSHLYKIETNYVVDGAATVLNGVAAPDDPAAVIDVNQLPRRVYQPSSAWSSPRNVLHRVIAESDYTSVEVSTPELDDVIRWADDAGRGHGRVDAEHAGSRR